MCVNVSVSDSASFTHVPWAHSWETLLAVLAKENTCLYVSVHTKVHMRMGVEM